MRTEINGTRYLKKYDDTKPSQPKTHKKKQKAISRQQARAHIKKPPKLLPGQQILTFRPKIIKQQEKQVNFFCYDENTMQWPQEFTRRIIHHNVDNDQQSNEYIVKKQVDKCVASLVEEIAFKRMMELDDTIGFDFLDSK